NFTSSICKRRSSWSYWQSLPTRNDFASGVLSASCVPACPLFPPMAVSWSFHRQITATHLAAIPAPVLQGCRAALDWDSLRGCPYVGRRQPETWCALLT